MRAFLADLRRTRSGAAALSGVNHGLTAAADAVPFADAFR
jgi:hypothetical protein